MENKKLEKIIIEPEYGTCSIKWYVALEKVPAEKHGKLIFRKIETGMYSEFPSPRSILFNNEVRILDKQLDELNEDFRYRLCSEKERGYRHNKIFRRKWEIFEKKKLASFQDYCKDFGHMDCRSDELRTEYALRAREAHTNKHLYRNTCEKIKRTDGLKIDFIKYLSENIKEEDIRVGAGGLMFSRPVPNIDIPEIRKFLIDYLISKGYKAE